MCPAYGQWRATTSCSGPSLPRPANTIRCQKQAYTSVLLFGTLSLLTGLVMYKPVQLSALGWFFGGYHVARVIHFLSMCGLLAFIPGHLIMVLLHGWDNFASMVTGWKRYPDYTRGIGHDDAGLGDEPGGTLANHERLDRRSVLDFASASTIPAQ